MFLFQLIIVKEKKTYIWVREESESLPLTQRFEGHSPGHSFPPVTTDTVRFFILLYWDSQEGRRVLQLYADLSPIPAHRVEHKQRVSNRGLQLKGTMHTNSEASRNYSNGKSCQILCCLDVYNKGIKN